jgi:hypothetical protein
MTGAVGLRLGAPAFSWPRGRPGPLGISADPRAGLSRPCPRPPASLETSFDIRFDIQRLSWLPRRILACLLILSGGGRSA